MSMARCSSKFRNKVVESYGDSHILLGQQISIHQLLSNRRCSERSFRDLRKIIVCGLRSSYMLM